METGCTKKLIRSKSGLRIVTTDERVISPFLLREPLWMPDKDIKNCSECNTKFDFLRRKHHCRRCGLIYCGTCCETRIDLPRMCFVDPVRVCDKCAIVTVREKDFFDHHLKTLTNGATFFIDSSMAVGSNKSLVCRLSPDHRHLIFEGAENKTLGPVDLMHIKSIGVLKNDDTDEHMDDFEGISSVEIVYAEDDLNNKKLKLTCAAEPHRKISNSWISAIHQAFKMLCDNQLTSK